MDTENNPVSCKLKIPKDIDRKTPAFVVDFANGNVNLNQFNKFKFSCYGQDSDGNSSIRRVLIASNGHLNYESGSDEIIDDRNKFNYFVGVRKKSSGKMKVFNAISFHLKPVLKENSLQSDAPETRNYRERTNDLDMNFGSKGKQRSLTAREKYSFNSDSLGDALQDVSLDDSVDNKDRSLLSASSVSASIDYLPPKNREAQTVDEVYKICDIISTVEDEYLDKEVKELLNDLPTHFSQWKTEGTFCEYVIDHLHKTDLDVMKVKYLLYYNYLSTFSKLLSSDLRKKDPAPEIPEPIRSCLLDRFTSTSVSEYGKVTRCLPLKMKDKLLAYILVLALIIDDYYVNLALIQKGTKFSLKKITDIAQALGCYMHRNKMENCVISVAELKLPLFVLHKYKKF